MSKPKIYFFTSNPDCLMSNVYLKITWTKSLKNKLLHYLSLIIISIRENDKNTENGGRDWIFLRWVNPILPWEPQRMLCTCALWESTGAREVGKEVLMAETVRSPFDYREPPTLDSDGDGSKPPPPRGWVSGASVRFVAVLGLLLSVDICEQKCTRTHALLACTSV